MSNKTMDTQARWSLADEHAAVMGEEIDVKEVPDWYSFPLEPRSASEVKQKMGSVEISQVMLRTGVPGPVERLAANRGSSGVGSKFGTPEASSLPQGDHASAQT